MKRLFTILAIATLSFSLHSQEITWAYLQWAASTTINYGENFEAAGAVFADGLTNAVNSTTGHGITCELGYSSANTNPSSEGWTWAAIPFNADWGTNFIYQGVVSGIPIGTFYYTFRFKLNDGEYKYAGTDGLWNGTNSVSGTLIVNGIQSEISWGNLQWAASTNINQGQNFEAGVVVFADGLTNAVNSTTGHGITCELGYSSSNTNPSSEGWTWTPIPFNADWGNNFYYQGVVSGTPAGSYYYTFRFKLNAGEYKYVGTDGLWNGTNSVSGTLTVNTTTGFKQAFNSNALMLRQNPIKNGLVQLVINDDLSGTFSIRIIDFAGRVLLQKEFSNASSTIDLQLADYPKGIYNLQVISPENKIMFFKLVLD